VEAVHLPGVERLRVSDLATDRAVLGRALQGLQECEVGARESVVVVQVLAGDLRQRRGPTGRDTVSSAPARLVELHQARSSMLVQVWASRDS
jgi:hypothetical protein